jgi:hypothetical protein
LSFGFGMNGVCSNASHSPQHVFDIDGLFFAPKRQSLHWSSLPEQHRSFHGPFDGHQAVRRFIRLRQLANFVVELVLLLTDILMVNRSGDIALRSG